jgi:hypothetical protein
MNNIAKAVILSTLALIVTAATSPDADARCGARKRTSHVRHVRRVVSRPVVYRTVTRPVVVRERLAGCGRVISSPIVLEGSSVVVRKRERGLIPKIYSFIFGG